MKAKNPRKHKRLVMCGTIIIVIGGFVFVGRDIAKEGVVAILAETGRRILWPEDE